MKLSIPVVGKSSITNGRGNDAGAEPLAIEQSWLSNPLDWTHIDRMILLGGLTQVVLTLGLGTLLAGLYWQYQVGGGESAYLNPPVAWSLAALYAMEWLALAVFIVVALAHRKIQQRWDAMETYIIYCYHLSALIGTFLTGTHFTFGPMILFIGTGLAVILMDIQKIRRAYWLVVLFIVVVIVLDVGHFARFAMLFDHMPAPQADGRPALVWRVVEIVLMTLAVAVMFINLKVVQRWAVREEFYRERSDIDDLTGLTNRRSFIEQARKELDLCQRTQSPTACIMLDIDHFKAVNDRFGHLVGDQVLVAIAAILTREARAYDIVGRYGGEEFAILLPRTDTQAAMSVAERIRTSIESAVIETAGQRVQVTGSLGVICASCEGYDTIFALLKAADEALYQVKREGRNRVVLYTDSGGASGLIGAVSGA
ncbi:MAG: GGDEF domain-containing protein [Porticoccaceae bacterium]